MAIELKGLTKKFGALTALDDVSVTFGEEKIYGLLGNNGAGKSTLMNCVTGRLLPTGGTMTVDGNAPSRDGATGRMFLLSEDDLYPEDMRVRTALDVAGRFYPDFDRAWAESLAQKFALDVRRKISKLSTGYATIFRLVVALSVNTPYLLLDEPVLGLDASHRDLFYHLLLEKYSEHPTTVVISTHLIAEVADLVERVVILKDGRLIENAAADDLTAEAYSVAGPAGLVDAYLTGRDVLSRTGLGGLKTACVRGAAPDGADLPAGLELSRVNLQDYFVSLMNGEGAQ